MNLWLHLIGLGLLLSLGAALWRNWHGPTQADRMMAAQLVGTGGVAFMIVLAVVQDWALLIVALALALLAALAGVGFVKSATPDGAGDPEEQPPAPILAEDENG